MKDADELMFLISCLEFHMFEIPIIVCAEIFVSNDEFLYLSVERKIEGNWRYRSYFSNIITGKLKFLDRFSSE